MGHIVVWSYDEEPPIKTSATYGLVLFQKHVSYELQMLIETLSDRHALLASYKGSYIYLFIRMDTLQSTPLPLVTEAPFPEARYFMWVSRLHPENIEYMQLHSISRLSMTKASREKALLCKKNTSNRHSSKTTIHRFQL